MRNAYLSAFLLLGACAQDSDGPSSQYDLQGRVIDDRTGRGLADAQVSFSSDTLDQAETSTDGDGRFDFAVDVRADVDFGTIRASHAAYADGSPRTVYFDGSSHAITLRLRAKAKTH
jgi:hypothetical protein